MLWLEALGQLECTENGLTALGGSEREFPNPGSIQKESRKYLGNISEKIWIR
jgi:hypothetical protein